MKRIIFLSFLLLLIVCPETSRAVFLKEQLDNKYYINIIVILDCSAGMNKIISSHVLTYMDTGEQLTVLKKEGEWYEVFSQKLNQRGWVIAFNVVGN